MNESPNRFLPTRASLLGRLKDWDDTRSWQEFDDLYRKLILSMALRSGLTQQEAEDVVQETLISVAKSIKEFRYDRQRCSFKTWLGQLTRRRIADRFRKRSREPAVSQPRTEPTSDTPTIERIPAPESLNLEEVWDSEWKQRILEAALQKVKTLASPEQYQIFDFYVLRKMPVKKVAAALGVSTTQVYLAKHRVGRLLQKETRSLEQQLG